MLAALLAPVPGAVPVAPVAWLDVPAQAEIDRLLSVYEAWVQIEEAQGDHVDPVASDGVEVVA